MNREIVTDPLAVEDLWSDLRETIALLRQTGVKTVFLLFGYSWGRFIYEGPWEDIPVEVDDVEPLVSEYEAKGFGKIGDDNLYLTVPEHHMKLQYSHETDIHISYSSAHPSALVEASIERWTGSGWLMAARRR
ncbi:MAG: hypothetical protein ACOWWM_15975 [Desulfobacterales bacterium]